MSDAPTVEPPPVIPLNLRFSLGDAQQAADEWRFNCGPSALCAVLNMTPAEIRPQMGDFERKGYTNPTLMLETLIRCGATYRLIYRKDEPYALPAIFFGVMRVQFSGPWTKPGVPMRVRYRHTHWVAARRGSTEIFDINAMCEGGWIKYPEWATQLIPWLIRECEPKADGGYWITHAYEVLPKK